jgi:hypothetical protein
MCIVAITRNLGLVQQRLQELRGAAARDVRLARNPVLLSELGYCEFHERRFFDALAHGPVAANEPINPALPAA